MIYTNSYLINLIVKPNNSVYIKIIYNIDPNKSEKGPDFNIYYTDIFERYKYTQKITFDRLIYKLRNGDSVYDDKVNIISPIKKIKTKCR